MPATNPDIGWNAKKQNSYEIFFLYINTIKSVFLPDY